MIQFDPSRPQSPTSERDAFESEMMPTGPVPMSGLAVAGFVSSIIFCCPVVSPLLGLIFSLLGLGQTRGGARRGRGLAIAGLIIALVFIPIHGLCGVWLARWVAVNTQLHKAVTELESSERSAAIGTLYGFTDESFRSRVSETQLTAWLEDHFSRRGGVQKIGASPTATPLPGGDQIRYSWTVGFPSENVVFSADCRLGIDLSGPSMVLVDLSVDDESAVQTIAGEEAPAPPPPSATSETGGAGD